MLLESLGNKTIDLNKNERQAITDEVLDLSINLDLKCRILVSNETFTVCGDCQAPVHEDLLPSLRFNESIEGKIWRCKNHACNGERNDRNMMKCTRCG